MKNWIKGMDLSSLLEVEECGARFSDGGVPGDAMAILRDHGANLIRLRLWNDPYAGDGTPYGAGTNDLNRTMVLARRAKALGMAWMLDLHYSDFWADPGKQTLPKAWRGMGIAELEQAVYLYTRSVLDTLRMNDLCPAMVAVGNEITNGLLWPMGRRPNYDNITRLVSAGLRAVDPDIETIVHLDNGGDNALYREWFDNYFVRDGADFDYIGLSYYPFWHGKMSGLKDNMNDIALRYGKNLIVVETSTGFTLEDYAAYEALPHGQRKGMAATAELAAKTDYPMTPKGQCAFLRDLAAVIREVPENRGRGFVYWEPAWIPVPGSGWANEAALRYTGEFGPGGNEWANQTLFNYDGCALPALETLRML